MAWVGNDTCFACGPANPIGLHLDFKHDGNDYVAEFMPRPEFQGYVGILHGGIVSTLLDEAMARLVWVKELKAVTAELHVKLRKPIPITEKILVKGRIVERHKRIIHCSAEIYFVDGSLAATAKGVFLELP